MNDDVVLLCEMLLTTCLLMAWAKLSNAVPMVS